MGYVLRCKICAAVLNPNVSKNINARDYIGHGCFDGDFGKVQVVFERLE